MKMYIKLIVLSLFTVLLSCAGIGIPDSSDPHKKLDYAFLAMNEGRHIPAERLIKGAIELFQKNNNEEGLAEAYFIYGLYYKYGRWTRGKPMISIEKSVEAFQIAISKYKELGINMGVAKGYFSLANAYSGLENIVKQCELYDESLIYYQKGLRGVNEKPFSINKNFEDFPQMVNSFKDKYCNKK